MSEKIIVKLSVNVNYLSFCQSKAIGRSKRIQNAFLQVAGPDAVMLMYHLSNVDKNLWGNSPFNFKRKYSW